MVDWTDQRWPAMNPWTEIECNLIEFGNQRLLEAKATDAYLFTGRVKSVKGGDLVRDLSRDRKCVRLLFPSAFQEL